MEMIGFWQFYVNAKEGKKRKKNSIYPEKHDLNNEHMKNHMLDLKHLFPNRVQRGWNMMV